jgi:hypothetical protein
MRSLLTAILCCISLFSFSQNMQNNPGSNHGNKFEQLGTILPTPNEYRTASGAPGPKYWQQRADYDIKCELDEKNLRLTGSETVTYYNNSPDVLTYIWLQLDENEHSSKDNAGYQSSSGANVTLNELNQLVENKTDNGYGIKITKLTDASGRALKYTLNKTMMRVELPTPLKPGQKFVFNCNWNYKIVDRLVKTGGRGGYEYFPEDGNYLFTMAQWYPRLCVYSDFQGWQNHQFTGTGEFALTFGNFKVQMTVPADHIVGSTGECLNYKQNLTPAQLARWNKAQTANDVVEVVTLSEATAAEKQKATAKKTWIYKADMVRDFAWTSSRKFVWDAMPLTVEGKKIMAMSYYAKEAYNLYRKYSTKAVAHTIRVYSQFSIPYPYPVAISVEASNGMEYPMICFNYGRTDKDGTYSETTKNGMLGVVIHEVGHNFFPMIVNSDERQWTWMDEGLNSYVQYLAQELWDPLFPSRRGTAWAMRDYMKLPKNQLEPIMTNSENIIQFGNNAYGKPATGLNILRETIVGRELFDYAFREYSRRWAFKHPTPADLFRTIEDATAEDLDWFWRGWFYSIDPVDISLDSVKHFVYDATTSAPTPAGTATVGMDTAIVNKYDDIAKLRNRTDANIKFQTDIDTSLRDFYWRYARGMVPYDPNVRTTVTVPGSTVLSAEEQQRFAGKHIYRLNFTNKGGMPMPLIIEWTYADGTKEVERISAQIWRKNENSVVKHFLKDKEVRSVKLDPLRETADIDETNNSWPQIEQPSRFNLFKQQQAIRGASTQPNPMQQVKTR